MTINKNVTAGDVIRFWFEEIEPKNWWVKDPAFDQMIEDRFLGVYEKAARSELVDWRYDAVSSLGEIIVLDQFPRNMFRDKARAFATDPLAVCLAQVAIDKGFDQELEPRMRSFMYMPLMHSESAEIHKSAEFLFSAPGLEDNYKFEIKHKEIIDRFGRYPHRNKILGRTSTDEELEFLKTPGSAF